MADSALEKLGRGQRLKSETLERAASYKMADTSFRKMIASSPEVLELLVPKSTKRGKNVETNLILTYVRALRAVSEVEEVLNNIPEEHFLLQCPEG
eukprot:9292594-Karenia_brevis.AAC.1